MFCRLKTDLFFLAVGFRVVLANTPKGCNRKYVPKHRGLLYLCSYCCHYVFALLLGALGVHMVIIVTVLGLALSPETLGLHPIAFALTLLGAWQTAEWFVPLLPLILYQQD